MVRLMGPDGWAQEGHWLPANDKYLGMDSQKIAAFSTIFQIWRNEIDISAASSAC
jgi:hypothetical protein